MKWPPRSPSWSAPTPAGSPGRWWWWMGGPARERTCAPDVILLNSQFEPRTSNLMYFSVVIPTHNRLDMLLRVLDALERQVDAPEFEVVVINDGSTDDTERVLSARSGITFRTQKNAGPGAARNRGVSLANGKFVVF